MRDFTKKNGEIDVQEFSHYLGYKAEGSARHMRKHHPDRFNIMYMGALCCANGISTDDLLRLIRNKKA